MKENQKEWKGDGLQVRVMGIIYAIQHQRTIIEEMNKSSQMINKNLSSHLFQQPNTGHYNKGVAKLQMMVTVTQPIITI